jgi:hypothetical protein
MTTRLRLILGGTAFAVTILGVTQLGWASSRSPQSGTVRKTTLTPGGDVASTRRGHRAGDGVFRLADPRHLDELARSGLIRDAGQVIAFGGRSFARVACQLRYPGWSGSIATTDQSAATVGVRPGAAEDQTMSLLWAATFPSSGSVRLVCWPEEQSGPSPSVSDASLVVTAVSSIAS